MENMSKFKINMDQQHKMEMEKSETRVVKKKFVKSKKLFKVDTETLLKEIIDIKKEQIGK